MSNKSRPKYAVCWFEPGDHSAVVPLPKLDRVISWFSLLQSTRGFVPSQCGMLRTERGLKLVCPGDWIFTLDDGSYAHSAQADAVDFFKLR